MKAPTVVDDNLYTVGCLVPCKELTGDLSPHQEESRERTAVAQAAHHESGAPEPAPTVVVYCNRFYSLTITQHQQYIQQVARQKNPETRSVTPRL